MVSYTVESAESVIQEGFNLIKEHWEEIAFYKEEVPLAPDYDKYRQLEESGQLFVVTARDDNDSLVGYSVYIIQQGLHYVSTKFAINDLVFISKEHRKGTAGIRLIKYAEQQLKKEGVEVIVMRVKDNKDFSKMLSFLGYDEMERTFSKYVKGE